MVLMFCRSGVVDRAGVLAGGIHQSQHQRDGDSDDGYFRARRDHTAVSPTQSEHSPGPELSISRPHAWQCPSSPKAERKAATIALMMKRIGGVYRTAPALQSVVA